MGSRSFQNVLAGLVVTTLVSAQYTSHDVCDILFSKHGIYKTPIDAYSSFPPLINIQGNDSVKILEYPHTNSKDELIVTSGRTRCRVPYHETYASSGSGSALLGNGKVLLSEAGANKEGTEAVYKLTVVDLTSCASYTFYLQLPGEMKPFKILTGYDSFDLLLPQPAKPAPTIRVLRYDDKLKLLTNFTADTLRGKDVSRLIAAEEHVPARGYYYVEDDSAADKLTVLKLDPNYHVQSFYTDTLDELGTRGKYAKQTFAAGHDKFSICHYEEESRKLMICRILSADLTKLISRTSLGFSENVANAKVMNFDQGIVLFTIRYRKTKDEAYITGAQFISTKGTPGDRLSREDLRDVFNAHSKQFKRETSYEIVSSHRMDDLSFAMIFRQSSQAMIRFFDPPLYEECW